MFAFPILASAGVWLLDHTPWFLAGAIVFVGLFVLGWSDLKRLSPGRVWALSGACFTESIRRRVLWVTPLAILGAIVVVQLQQPLNEQDAIRQTTRFCLFASGLLVAVTGVILACTNLPREIENRVIYTIVTKPTTRLEIILGKVVGFARVSAMILLIMGLFTFGYLQLRNWRMVGHIEDVLAVTPKESPTRATLEYYAGAGLLTTKSLEQAEELGIYSRRPKDSENVHWMNGAEGGYFSVPFDLSSAQKQTLIDKADAPVIVRVEVELERHDPTTEQSKELHDLQAPMEEERGAPKPLGPVLAQSQPAKSQRPVPRIQLRLLDEDGQPLTRFNELADVSLTAPSPDSNIYEGHEVLKPDDVEKILRSAAFSVEVSAVTPSVEYGVRPKPVSIYLPDPRDAAHPQLVIDAASRADGRTGPPTMVNRVGRHGMQITAKADGKGAAAVYRFRGAGVGSASSATVPIQLNVGIERGGEFGTSEGADLSVISVEVVNAKTDFSSGPIHSNPETQRTNYIDVPRAAVEGGNFDVVVRGLTNGQILGVKADSVALVTADQSFAFNLFKSLFILWLLSVLVVIVSVFASTFLSWPIAVVLTLVILLGHWGVEQLGDALRPGVGRSVSTDFQLRDPVTSKLVSSSVDVLAKSLRMISVFLPDVSKFPVIEDIERGVSISPARMKEAFGVLFCYGLPMVVLSYIILKNKEVAP